MPPLCTSPSLSFVVSSYRPMLVHDFPLVSKCVFCLFFFICIMFLGCIPLDSTFVWSFCWLLLFLLAWLYDVCLPFASFSSFLFLEFFNFVCPCQYFGDISTFFLDILVCIIVESVLQHIYSQVYNSAEFVACGREMNRGKEEITKMTGDGRIWPDKQTRIRDVGKRNRMCFRSQVGRKRNR